VVDEQWLRDAVASSTTSSPATPATDRHSSTVSAGCCHCSGVTGLVFTRDTGAALDPGCRKVGVAQAWHR
jgi:hypothetical protein